LPSLFPTLLHYCGKCDTSDNAQQLLALQCLLNLGSAGEGGGIGYAKIKGYVQMVIFKLEPVLAHKQRRVRMGAVVVRNAYIMLSSE
jgi:hypothetical protein